MKFFKNENGNILSAIIFLFLLIIILAFAFTDEPSNSNTTISETPTLTSPVPSPITIHSFTYNVDYAGGVEWNFSITNNTEKTINYIFLKWNCYNAVGDLIYDEITHQSYYNLKFTGPLLPHTNSGTKRNTTKFYNHSYNNAKLYEIEIFYEDGTSEKLESKNLSYYENLLSN